MRAGCFAETRVIDLLNRRFVPFFFNRGGPGKGHDEAARKFTVGKTENKFAYLAAFEPDGTYLGETHVYADKDAVFAWLRRLLIEHPEYDAATEAEAKLLASTAKADRAEIAKTREELGEYDAAVESYTMLLDTDDTRSARLALLRIARYRKRWKEHARLEEMFRAAGDAKALRLDLDVERSYRLLAEKNWQAVRALLRPATLGKAATDRLAEIHFNLGIACWFMDDRDHAKYHWCWIVDHLPDDRLYMRARVAAAAEIMPYPNPELGGYKARGMIGTGHIVREVEKSMRIYRRIAAAKARERSGR